MTLIKLDSSLTVGKIKPMHCVNNGPIYARADQCMGNFRDYSLLKIPYMRNHDAAFCSGYGGEHTVDVNLIFRDFDREPNDESAYDFTLTDIYLRNTLNAGTKIFYRLGSKIEHEVKKYNTKPPKDYLKWAKICEHIIAHYNEGWAGGYNWNILYWEIWNEPDNADVYADPSKCSCWGGTREEFFKFFRIAATYLKKRFPQLKIGGPAVAWNINDWTDAFLKSMTEGERVPLDFFSWHCYGTKMETFRKNCRLVREKLDQAGYTATESIMNEYNYVRDWAADFNESIRTIISMKGAAFTLGYMITGQNEPVDMMMYYDARPCAMNGLFDFYTYARLKGYYSIKYFSVLYEYGTQLKCVSDDSDVMALAARADDGRVAMLICYYSEDDNALSKEIELEGCEGFSGNAFKVDCDYNGEQVFLRNEEGRLLFRLKRNSFVLLTD